MPNKIILIPTYNEVLNIETLIRKLLAIDPNYFIVVIDDNSPDGTADVVRRIEKENSHVFLIFQKNKGGLGMAYINAFAQVLSDKDISQVAMMDADFSHNPDYLPKMFELAESHDVVIGSRYVKNGGVSGWEMWRRWLSFLANLYCKTILRVPIFDVTSGFYVINAKKLRNIDFSLIDVSGYAFQIEFKYILYKKGLNIVEFPILFKNRVGGESKISNHIIWEGIVAPWKMITKKFSTPNV